MIGVFYHLKEGKGSWCSVRWDLTRREENDAQNPLTPGAPGGRETPRALWLPRTWIPFPLLPLITSLSARTHART